MAGFAAFAYANLRDSPVLCQVDVSGVYLLHSVRICQAIRHAPIAESVLGRASVSEELLGASRVAERRNQAISLHRQIEELNNNPHAN